jgi:small-conductance mechanosensitive channel
VRSIIAFALVIALSHIPARIRWPSLALFLGVIFSLGSSSFIANMMAGLSMTYRGAFKEGERIRIGEVMGAVEEIKLMVTRIRTPKNEIVIIPNSNILNTNVVNYSALARQQGLVLHTEVGIGYETPWRQVEAMLLQAASRTEGIKSDPKPFVLQRALGDF